jgi:GntR family histidine utilization transcriptional repressor
MTANRAVRELQREGLVTRTAGSGSFVARRVELSLLRVPDIAEEIRAGFGSYGARLVESGAVEAEPEVAAALALAPGARVLRTLIVHESASQPVQAEERHVNPAFAPDYLAQDFSAHTPNAYLTAIGEPDEVEQTVEATAADARTARLLDVPRGHCCLRVTRRTWSAGIVASLARLDSPGDRWRLTVRFRP